MPVHRKTLLIEMTVIVVVAVTLGLIWNHRLLWERYSGKPASPKPPPSLSAVAKKNLIPAGLMQVQELFQGKDAVFIDARESSVFMAGHIKGAVSVPLGEVASRIPGLLAKVPFTKVLVIYCGGFGCHDSKTLGTELLKKGYQQVLIFEGGYPEWKSAGLPVEGTQP